MIKHRQVQRRGRRSQMTTRYGADRGLGRRDRAGGELGRGGGGGVRAGRTRGEKLNRGTGPDQTGHQTGGGGSDWGTPPTPDSSTFSFTDPAVSMDLLRAVLQPSINEEIRAVFNKYMKVRAAGTGPVPSWAV